jgi:hypothetical protein
VKKLAYVLVLAAAACGGGGGGSVDGPKNPGDVTPPTASKPAVMGFAKRADSLKVDKVAGNDGNLKPDGRNDAAFDVTLRGPLVALFLFSTNEKGDPDGSWQYDTIVGTQDYPATLKSYVAKGGMTSGIGVFEGDKLLNKDDGSLAVDDKEHKVVIYLSDIGAFQPGSHFKLMAEAADHSILSSDVVTY